MFLLGDPPDYEQPPRERAGARRRAQGRQPEELAYERCCSRSTGSGMLYVPFLNYADGNLDATREMLIDPQHGAGPRRRRRALRHDLRRELPDLSADALDARPHARRKLPLAFVVAGAVARDRARGRPPDRGLIAPGYKADLNVIDYDRLHLHPPKVHYDLPVGGRRLLQDVDGYDATIVSGVVTRRHGEATGRRPGKLTGVRRG